MITEAEKEKQKLEKLQNGVRICEDAMAKAEKYERLKDNKDWQGFIGDLKILGDLHDREIKMGESMLLDAPNNGYLKMDGLDKQQYVSSRQDWIDFIVRHQIQKEECVKWTKEPEHIMTMASMCRDKLPQLKKEIEEISRGTVEATGK